MSKAFKCNLCEKHFDGNADTQSGHNEDLERAINFSLGIKFSPENKEAQFYIKDLCPDCAKLYCRGWSLLKERNETFLRFLKEVNNG